MRTQRNYFNENNGIPTKQLQSSFLSCEKDTELIVKKLFVDSNKYSDMLKRLMLINTTDCLTDLEKDEESQNQAYKEKIDETSISDMIDAGYIRFQPKLSFNENEEVKSYILISFDNFSPTNNPHFRDCLVEVDILCHLDCWNIGNYRQRPLKIAGYVDGILNETKLSGIGTLNFLGANELILNESLAGYSLLYRAEHGEDDLIEPTDD